MTNMRINPMWNKQGRSLQGFAMNRWLAARGDTANTPTKMITHKFGFEWTPKTEEQVIFCRANIEKISSVTRENMFTLGSVLSKRYENNSDIQVDGHLNVLRCGITSQLSGAYPHLRYLSR